MNIIVGFEESGKVTAALRKAGHNAFSCDLLPTRGNPRYHYEEDIFRHLDKAFGFYDGGIFFPPCTDLAVSGAKHFEAKRKDGSQEASIKVFMKTVLACRDMPLGAAIENPVGIMSSYFRKPDQIIHPWQHGHKASKKTCLWLFGGMPLIKPTKMVGPPKKYKDMTPEELAEWTAIHRCPPGPMRQRIRSETYQGVANAMAKQWFKNEIYKITL